MTLLLREAIGDRLRRVRTAQHRTLREVSRAARVSLGYLSEVERGRKEASSELLAAICGALDLPLADLLLDVAGDLGNGGVSHTVIEPDFDRELDRVIEGGRLAPAMARNAKAELRIAPALSRRLTEQIQTTTVSTSGPVRAAVFAA